MTFTARHPVFCAMTLWMRADSLRPRARFTSRMISAPGSATRSIFQNCITVRTGRFSSSATRAFAIGSKTTAQPRLFSPPASKTVDPGGGIQGREPRGGMSRGRVDSGGLQPLDGGKIGNTPAMKITEIKTFLVGAGGRNWVYVKILTDQGIYGIGEAYSAGPDEATVKVIEDFKSWLIGNDPRNVQYLFDLMYNTTRFPGGLVV